MSQPSDLILERMMALHPKIIDLVLDRVHRLLAALNHPERRLPPVIHLAGTNGKGSTQAIIRAGLEAAGHSVHAYTSPHLARFHERIRLAGDLISEPALSALLERCYAANDGADITYFEITTVAAMLAMAETPADFVLLETGLGGRLDATNVVDQPRLTILTPIDLDHQDFLGETLAEIAAEKAGILKRGCPVIVAPQHEAALEVIEARAARLSAPRLIHGQEWHFSNERGRLVVQDEQGLLDLPAPALPGPHQFTNAATAVIALRQLGIGEEACAAAMRNVEWPGRMQRLRSGPIAASAPKAEIWLDGGHNPAAGVALAATLAALPARPTHLICGMLNTKDARGYLAPLAPLAETLTAIPIPDAPSSLPPAALADMAKSLGHRADQATDLPSALARITQIAPEARLLICGSLYLVGDVLRRNAAEA